MAEPAGKYAAWGTARLNRRLEVSRHVGARMRERRISLGLTVSQMAELIEASLGQVRKYEKGMSAIPSNRIYYIAQALGVDVGYLFEGLDIEQSFRKTPQQRRLLELARNFIAIENREHQEEICALARAYAEHEDSDGAYSSQLAAPVKFLAKLMDSWAIDEQQLARLLGFDDAAEVGDLLAGERRLDTRDTKDRVRHLLRIREALHSLFRNLDAEREWLREPRSDLQDQSPLALLVEGSMENLLVVSQLVQWMVGR